MLYEYQSGEAAHGECEPLSRHLRAALVSFSPGGETQLVIVFQYNPETLTRSFQSIAAIDSPTTPSGEVISFTMSLDAVDFDVPVDPAAQELGILPTLTALEQLAAEARGQSPPYLLFIWGPHRMLAVELASLVVRETAFNAQLAPVRSDVDVVLHVLEALPQRAPQAVRKAQEENQAARKRILDKLSRDLPGYVARILK